MAMHDTPRWKEGRLEYLCAHCARAYVRGNHSISGQEGLDFDGGCCGAHGRGAVTPGHAFGTLVNWNILGIYLGSLVLAELFIYSRVPAFIAERIVKRSPSIGVAVTIILLLAGLVSAFVENVATVLLVAPIMIELAKKGKNNLAPLMIGLAVMANLQGTATLVGDPPSMIFANYAGLLLQRLFL